MDWYESVFELIDMRSFSNLWFWIALAVLWSSASHRVLGVPWDMVMRARKEQGGEADDDLRAMVRVNVKRLLYIGSESGLLITGFACFALTFMFVTGFFFDNEFAQALFLLGLPTSFLGWLSISTAKKLYTEEPEGEALYDRLHKHRLFTQITGMISIFITAIWGMLQNMNASVLF